MMGTLFMIAASIVILGWLWFYLARPILEDYGVIGVPEDVNTSEPVMSRPETRATQTKQTDEADRPQTPDVSALLPLFGAAELDRTRNAWIDLMVYRGYTVGEIRSILKGDNGVIGMEVEAARQRLGIDPPERTLRVRDERGERVIPV